MRILPVALACLEDADLINKASEFSSLTHAHERSRWCCAFYCLVMGELFHRSSVNDATEFAWAILDDIWEFSPAEREHFERIHPEALFTRTEEEIPSSGHVIDTLMAALWVNRIHDNFEEVVLHAVNLGEDTDTTACVAGGLAGIRFGFGAISQEWVSQLAAPTLIETLSKGFLTYCADQEIETVSANHYLEPS